MNKTTKKLIEMKSKSVVTVGMGIGLTDEDLENYFNFEMTKWIDKFYRDLVNVENGTYEGKNIEEDSEEDSEKDGEEEKREDSEEKPSGPSDDV